MYSASRVQFAPLNASACCSTVSRTIFQKMSDTAMLRFPVVIWVGLSTPSLKAKENHVK